MQINHTTFFFISKLVISRCKNFNDNDDIVVPAGIVSFGESLWVQRGHSIRLPCIIVGAPAAERVWNPLSGGSRQLDDGTLVIEQMQKQNQDNYTCTASNINGISSIIYSLHILGKYYIGKWNI